MTTNSSNLDLLNFIVSLIIVFGVFIFVDMYDLTFREFDRTKNVSKVVTIEKYINKKCISKHHID